MSRRGVAVAVAVTLAAGAVITACAATASLREHERLLEVITFPDEEYDHDDY